MSRSRGRRYVTSWPSSAMVPPVGYSSPAIMRSVVVLPQPEGPSSTTNLPLSSTSEEPRTAVKSAKRFCRFWILISLMDLLLRGPPRNRLCRAAGGAPLRGRRRRRFGGGEFPGDGGPEHAG